MREIKFRAWDLQNKVMVYIGDNRGTEIIGIHFRPFDVELFDGDECYNLSDISDFEIMQYTGLKDKNGKEIYEGDILDMDGLCFVIWKEGAYWIESPGSNAQDLPSSQDFEKSTVLGNIHENPELLEE